MTTLEARSYSREVVLRDGESLLLRALRPDDKPRLLDLFRRMSQRSIRHRFMAAKTSLSEAELVYLTEIDFRTHVALVAISRKGGEERIAGVGRYIWTDPQGAAPAEAAFAVADADQGRGIGTLLLEHLAAIAAASGVAEFQADVEADNDAMMEVFEDSGFTVRRSLDSRIFHVTFPTRSTDRFVAASLERERRAAAASVRALFEPTSVAVVGASSRPETIGRALIDNLARAGFAGAVYPVHPTAHEIAGRPAFPSLSACPGPVDLAVIAVPAAAVESVLAEAARAGVHGAVVISSGFAEVGGDGRAVEKRLREIARSSGMRMVGPNCMGLLNTDPAVRLDVTFSPVAPPPGNVSMLSQSGALGLAIIDHARRLDIGIAQFISVGNKSDVSGNDLLSYWMDDPRTQVIALYLESLGNPRKFARLAPQVARKKPIVAVKSGRSAAGTRAASSHSAALASVDIGVDALFAQAGVIRTTTLEELFDVVALLSSQPVPAGRRVAVVTNAGGPGILLADACEAHGLSLPTLAPETLDRLRAFLPAQAGLSNPIDMIASASPADYERAIEVVAADPAVDALVVVYVPPLVTRPEEIAAAIARAAGTVPPTKPVACVFLSARGTPAVLSSGPRGKIPSYSFPENAAIALSHATSYGEWRRRPTGTVLHLDRDQERRAREVIAAARSGGTGKRWLAPDAALELVAGAGIRVAAWRRAAPLPEAAAEAAAAVGFPVVLKAIAPDLVHKTEAGAVALGLTSREAVLAAAAAMHARIGKTGAALEGFLVQEQVRAGVEALVGITTDPSFGPLVVAGLGGVQVELLRDAAFRLPPVSDLDAAEMIDRLRMRALLDGYRGAPPGDRAALVSLLQRVSAL
ncbi:MAG TPA: GNAT family N-acetyltransferase, partial [Kofleriaceae bacterium]|nr:GNAT family N-acetyltransferase [Kofleriaceae bacterium]